MIGHNEIKDVLHRLNTSLDPQLIDAEFAGLLMGFSLAVKNQRLVRQLDTTLREQWTATHGYNAAPEDQGLLYGPGLMAEALNTAFAGKIE